MVSALLDELDEQALDRLAELLGPRLEALTKMRTTTPAGVLLSCSQAATRAGVHVETIRRAVRSGALKVRGRVGKQPRIAPADLDKWLATGMRGESMAPRPRRRPPSQRSQPLRDTFKSLQANGRGVG